VQICHLILDHILTH